MNLEQAINYLESVGYLRIRGVKIEPGTYMEFRDVERQGYVHLYSAKEVKELAADVKKGLDLPRNWRLCYDLNPTYNHWRYFLEVKVDGIWHKLTNYEYRPINFYTRESSIERVRIEANLRRSKPTYRKATYSLYGAAI